LCGAFNSNVRHQSRSVFWKTSRCNVCKENDVLVKTSVVIDNQSAVYDDLTFDNVAVIADALMEKFVSGDYDKIELIYNQFKKAATQNCSNGAILPLAAVQSDQKLRLEIIFLTVKEEIIMTLIPKSLKTQ
jgi:F-type H+-transporting ATPase subunit gamma